MSLLLLFISVFAFSVHAEDQVSFHVFRAATWSNLRVTRDDPWKLRDSSLLDMEIWRDKLVAMNAKDLDELRFTTHEGSAIDFQWNTPNGAWGTLPVAIRTGNRSNEAQILLSVARKLADANGRILVYAPAVTRRILAYDRATPYWMGPEDAHWRDLFFVDGDKLISVRDIEIYLRSKLGFWRCTSDQSFTDQVVDEYFELEDAPHYGGCEGLLRA